MRESEDDIEGRGESAIEYGVEHIVEDWMVGVAEEGVGVEDGMAGENWAVVVIAMFVLVMWTAQILDA